MEPTFDDVLYLYTRFHGRHPTTEERGALEHRLRFGHVLEPPWERLARPTDLGPSRLGLLWLVLESGPGGRHPGVVAALEGLRGASEVGEALSFEARRAALARALNGLLEDEREPLVSLDLALRLAREPGPCGQCGGQVPGGLVGWYAGCGDGPLCRDCLGENAPSLAVLLDAVIFGLPRALEAADHERRHPDEQGEHDGPQGLTATPPTTGGPR